MGEIIKTPAKLYTIQIKDEKDQVNPVICRREKIDNKVVLTPTDGLQGNFDRVEFSTYHSDTMDKDVENINIYLWDKEGEYKLSTARTGIGRSILNTLAGEKELGLLTFSVYSRIKDGKTYASVSIYNDGQKTNWKLSVEDQKKLIEPITKKDGTFVSNDYSELDKTLKSFVEDINKKAKILKNPQEYFDKKVEEENSDLPF